MNGEPRLTDAEVLELEQAREALEEPLTAAQDDGGDDDRQLVDEVGLERLPDHVRTTHDVNVLVARGIAGARPPLRPRART